MSNTRTLTLFESPYDLGLLNQNQWLWQVAKSVATINGPAQSNVVWKSQALAPTMTVSYEVEYGLNWTASLPTDGVTVTIGGDWQECDKGQVYDIDTNGFWQPSQSPGVSGWMKVGNVGYKYPNVPGLHIVVGVKNALSGQWEPIFVDSTSLPPGSTASYQPQEKVQWWFSGQNMTGQVYSRTQGAVRKYDFTNPATSTGNYAWWTTYTFSDSSWSVFETAPTNLQTLVGPPASEAFFEEDESSTVAIPWPVVWKVTLAVAAIASQPKLCSDVVSYLKTTQVTAECKFQVGSGNVLSISYGPPKSASPGTRAMIGFFGAMDSTQQPINNALTSLKGKDLPANETWTFSNSTAVAVE